MSTITAPQTPSGTYGYQSVIGGPTGSGLTGGFANTKNSRHRYHRVVRGVHNSFAFDFGYCAAVYCDGSAQIFASPVTGTSPVISALPGQSAFSNAIGTGMRSPVIGNNVDIWVPKFWVEGYTNGYRLAECFAGGAILSVYTSIGIDIDFTVGTSGTAHAISIVEYQARLHHRRYPHQRGWHRVRGPVHRLL